VGVNRKKSNFAGLASWREKDSKPKSISDANHRHCHGGRINVFCVRINGKFSSILGSSEEDRWWEKDCRVKEHRGKARVHFAAQGRKQLLQASWFTAMGGSGGE
jgi:hypothetical protein